MRIYSESLELPSSIDHIKIPYEKKEEIVFLSDYGYYRICNKQLYLFKVNNDKHEMHEVNNNKFILSYSYWQKRENHYCLPYEHKSIKIIKYEYKILDNLLFVIEVNNNTNGIIDYYYLTTDNNKHNKFIWDEIIRFYETLINMQ
uniref:Uncharacterized protein n=1 Tax=viral metagenome TaxID=1070528 RepID=A0A6C0KIH0_9ZZZZ